MPRKRTPLDPTYGVLTVINDPPEGLKTQVRCRCGVEKWVLRSNLTSHRLSSCGAPSCRTRSTLANPKPLSQKMINAIRLPTWLPLTDVPHVVKQLENKANPMVLGVHYGVHVQTIYNFIKTVRQCGGVANYLAAVDGKLKVTDAVAGNPELVVAPTPTFAEPGQVPTAPRPYYQP